MNEGNSLRPQNIPLALRERRQWVLWRFVTRDGKTTKLPYQWDGRLAEADDPATWCHFDEALAVFAGGKYSGLGYEFSRDDPFIGIDLDGCRNPHTGEIASWAKSVIVSLDSYAEVSPSQTGVKIFCVATSPFPRGRNVKQKDAPNIANKTPSIEVYDWGRYFAVTGFRLAGLPLEPQSRQREIDALCTDENLFPPDRPKTTAVRSNIEPQIVERARRYLAKIPPAVSGQNGHGQTFYAACQMVLGFGLDRETALTLMNEYSKTCDPPWSEREIEHKVESAMKEPGQRGYLLNRPSPSMSTRASAICVEMANRHASRHRRNSRRTSA